jgi:hypothetical protein
MDDQWTRVACARRYETYVASLSAFPEADQDAGYPPEHINAVLTHTLHFIRLLTFYLGVKLPFEVTWSGDTASVGQPYIAAGKGSESGGWAR